MSLQIIAASAGSGKTFRLSREYVIMALAHKEASYASSILAMTFTNKATAEMKHRILSLLHDLAYGKIDAGSVHKDDPLISLFQKMEASEVRDRAGRTLRHLIKHYHQFSIFTLDSFFQRMVRHFQRELSLDHPFTVELNQDSILQSAVQHLFSKLHAGDPAFDWILAWAGENLDSNQSWNVKNKLLSLGHEIFKEGVSESWEDVSLSELQEVISRMRAYIVSVDEALAQIRDRVGKLVAGLELAPSDFSYGNSGFMGAWLNQNKGLTDLFEAKRFNEAQDSTKWFTKKEQGKRKHEMSILQEALPPLWEETQQLIQDHLHKYNSYVAVLGNVRNYVALRFLYASIQEVCREQDVILLSESNKLVSRIVQESDANVLYERSGDRYKHIMIDEFQDTSGTQWQNIKPLIEQSLSTMQPCLIVGDIKQAIYRWRNGDWQIMHSKVKEDLTYFREMIQEESLANNFRSAAEIVAFNNDFFERFIHSFAEGLEQEDIANPLFETIQEIYADVRQYARAKHEMPGGVEIEWLLEEDEDEDLEDKGFVQEGEEADDSDGEAWIAWLQIKLSTLYSQGFKAGDLAILVRKQKQVSAVIDVLERFSLKVYGEEKLFYRAVSDRGFLLKNDLLTQTLIAALALKIDPRNTAQKGILLTLWNQLHKQDAAVLTSKAECEQSSDLLSFVFQTRLNSLTEWFMSFIEHWGLEKESVGFSTAFLDQVRQYELQHGNDPSGLLQWWELNKENLGAGAGAEPEAIQVMTVHKSKGLQFPVVLMPFLHAPIIDIKHYNNMYVRVPADENLNQLGWVPVPMAKKKLAHTWFYEQMSDERLMSAIDTLNILYVAFTRPELRLYAAVKTKKGNLVSKMLDAQIWGALPEEDKKTDQLFQSGDLQAHKPLRSDDEGVESSKDVLQIDALHIRKQSLRMGTWLDKPLPVLGLHEEEWTPAKQGTLIHAILAESKQLRDVPVLLKNICEEALCTEAQTQELASRLNPFVELPEVENWFDASHQVYAEKEIIEVDGQSYRPDRVIVQQDKTVLIDFKTGKPSEKYHKQLRQYADLLYRMGLPSVEAHIAYVDELFIQTVSI